MKILITGAPGYIGSHLVKLLAENGKHVLHGLDNNWRQNDVVKYLDRVHYSDITRNPLDIDRAHEFDTVVHLAAKTMVQKSVENPLEYLDTNINGTTNLANHIKDRCGHFIYGSTGCAIDPDSSPYALSKRAGEIVIQKEFENHSICRFYNVSGNSGFKKFDDSYYHLMRKAAAVAAGRFDEINIYGDGYSTRDGTAVRNFTHVWDIVQSIERIIENGPTRKIENLGNSGGYTVRQVIAAMEKVSGKTLKTVIGPRRLGDLPVSILPDQSQFFEEQFSLEQQCLSAFEFESELMKQDNKN